MVSHALPFLGGFFNLLSPICQAASGQGKYTRVRQWLPIAAVAKGHSQLNDAMVIFFLTVFVLSMVITGVIPVLQDKRRIRAYLQRRGATQIHIRTQYVGRTNRIEAENMQRRYEVTYLSATGQPCRTQCVSNGIGLLDRSIDWADGMSDIYDLLPDQKTRQYYELRED